MADTRGIGVDPHGEGIAVMCFTDRLDLDSTPEARTTLARTISGGHHPRVVALSRVGFGCLIGGKRQARQAGGDPCLANPTDRVAMVLSLTPAVPVLTVSRTIEEALRVAS